MIDTGASVNILKENALKPSIKINEKRIFNLLGIGTNMVKTLGEIKLSIKGKETSFQIVDKDFPIEHEGILGTPFLKQQGGVLNFIDECLHLGEDDIPLISNSTIKLKARSKTLVEIPIIKSNLSEGYIDRIEAGPGIYAGQALVSNVNQRVRLYMINSTNENVELSIPPLQLEECIVAPSLPRSFKDVETAEKEDIDFAKRFSTLLDNLHLEGLNDEEKDSILNVFKDFSYQFFLPGDKLNATNVLKHKINTVDDIPIHVKQYRYAFVHKQELQSQLKELKDSGIIRASNSPSNSPLWIVPKKADSKGNKKWRMVIDYRKLNEKTVGDAYPLVNITDILDQLGGAKYFSIFDLAKGFYQIPLDPESIPKTAFSGPFGHYEFTRMPFGLKTAPNTFQRLMDQVLSGLQGIELFVYMDDIIIYANSIEEHTRKLKSLLGRLKTAGLALQPDKCYFLRREICYLGHVISEDGVKPDPNKIIAVKEFPIPSEKGNLFSLERFTKLCL